MDVWFDGSVIVVKITVPGIKYIYISIYMLSMSFVDCVDICPNPNAFQIVGVASSHS